jgi:hypothetical protein
MISKTIDVVVTSVLQTTAGKMIFGRFIDPSVAAAQAASQADRDDQGPPRRARPVPQPQVPAAAAGSAAPPAASGPATPVPGTGGGQ